MVDETTTTLETEGKNAIEDAKASLSGLPTDGVTKVRVELTRVHDTDDTDDDEVADGGTQGRQGRERKLQNIQQDTAFHTLLTYLDQQGPATSKQVGKVLDMPMNTIGSGLSDLWHRKLADREGSPPYTYSINQHGKCLLEDYGRVDLPWASEDRRSESEKGGSTDGGTVNEARNKIGSYEI